MLRIALKISGLKHAGPKFRRPLLRPERGPVNLSHRLSLPGILYRNIVYFTSNFPYFHLVFIQLY